MNTDQFLKRFKEYTDRMNEILVKKNTDYAGSKVSPFGNFELIAKVTDLDSTIDIGFLTRMSDKLSRLGSFVKNGTLAVKDESVKDTLIDLANYSLIYACYLDSTTEAKKFDPVRDIEN